MSMASDTEKTARRVPQQERAARRVEAFLDAAAETITERGFEAATMTEIAERAGASIGSVYQYFPNKDALVFALRTRYGDTMDAQWSALTASADGLAVAELVERLFALLVEFMDTHPAYLPLLSVSLNFKRDAAVRNRLRKRFAELFQRYQPALPADDAFRVAEVALQVVKSMSPLYIAAKPKERAALIREYKAVLTAYLSERLA
ncbi:MAG TPA: TetR/AcrR family transcriptional regulator [Paraburkholderia sp.]